MAAQRKRKPAHLSRLTVSEEDDAATATAAPLPQIHSPTHTRFETPPKATNAPAAATLDINSPTGADTRTYDFDEETGGGDGGSTSATHTGQAVASGPPPAHALAGVITQAGADGKQVVAHTPPGGTGAVSVQVPATTTASPAGAGAGTTASTSSRGGGYLCCRSSAADEPSEIEAAPTTPQRVQVGAKAPPTPNARYPNSPTHHGWSKAHGSGDATPTPMKAAPSAFPDGPLAEHAPFALLPPATGAEQGRVCCVLDLDETLVHSSFEPVPDADYVIPVEIDSMLYNVYVCKRPGCDDFLLRMGKAFEVVVFTASLAKYANPLLDKLDIHGVIKHRLFREACVYHQGSYVKDMTMMGRPITRTLIVDNSPASYMFQPENALGCSSFVDQQDDVELWAIADFLEALADSPDVRTDLSKWVIP